MRLIHILFLTLFSLPLLAQMSPSQKMQLAVQYQRQGEHEKALSLFEDLYELNPSRIYYQGIVKSKMALSQFDELEKFIKKERRKGENKYNPIFSLDLGVIKLQTGETEKAEKIFEEVIEDLPANEYYLQETGRQFQEIGKDDLAIKTYEKARKLYKNETLFLFELSRLYNQAGETEKVVEEYLNLLEVNSNRMEEVKNNLQDMLDEEEDKALMQAALYKRIQRNPDNVQFPELLIWLQLQQNDWNGALLQAKAIDRRQ